ncbi:MAG: peptidoglycan-binding domain-containing protein [Leptolyngbya sp.]|nr:peptidoglycan-binding domain-containing protein [Leptolyngbya sp.]
MPEDRPPAPSLWLNPPPLAPGDEGDLVQQLQTALTQGGWYLEEIDGLYGNATTQAVKAFQAEQGLPANGIAGVETWQRLLLRLEPQQILAALPSLTVETLTFTPLVVAQPPPPPSPLWLLLMALIPLLGGALTYLKHRWLAKHQR